MQMGATTKNNYNIRSNTTVYIGMDVHKDSFTLCAFTVDMKEPSHIVKIPSDYKQILKYMERMRTIFGNDADFICGYEAGCLGYSLYHDLTKCNVKCEILAPTTMLRENGKRVKTDSRDAALIAKCLAYHTYKSVYVPTKDIEEVKEYIRMRSCHKKHLKSIKQQILAFCLREGLRYSGGNWTIGHLEWLRTLDLPLLCREILDEYMITLNFLTNKIEQLDNRIADIARTDYFEQNVHKLICLKGIQIYTAMAIIAEVGDFSRFQTADKFAAFLGLVPGESSSGDSIKRLGITKAGNSILRTLIIEAAHCYGRSSSSYKTKAYKKRREGASSKVLAYADRANERLYKRFRHLLYKNKKRRCEFSHLLSYKFIFEKFSSI